MEKFYDIHLINHLKGNMSCQFNGNITLSEMINKYCSKIGESPDKFGKTISILYKGVKLDPNSSQTINNIFKTEDEVFISYDEDKESIEKEIIETKKLVNRRQSIRRRERSIREEIEIEKEKDIEVDDILNDMAKLGNMEKLMFEIDKKKKKEEDNYTSIDYCLTSGDDQFFILGILAKYLQKIGINPIIEKSDVTNDEEEQDYANTLLQFICNGYLLKYKYILDFGLKQERVDQLYNDNNESNKFNQNLKKLIVEDFSLNGKELLIKEFKKTPKPNEYSVILVFKSDLKTELSEKDLLAKIKKNKQFKQITNVKKEFIMETVRLNRSMLDSIGNNKSDSRWGYNEERGGEPYYPPVGCHRYGLRVFNKYDDQNNDWLSYDNRPGEWCIAYSSLYGNSKNNENIYENEKDLRTGKRVGSGVCCYTKCDIMMEKTEIINANGVNYKMGLMLRVKPDKVRKPKSNKNVWIVNGTVGEIRPYGILLKKV